MWVERADLEVSGAGECCEVEGRPCLLMEPAGFPQQERVRGAITHDFPRWFVSRSIQADAGRRRRTARRRPASPRRSDDYAADRCVVVVEVEAVSTNVRAANPEQVQSAPAV